MAQHATPNYCAICDRDHTDDPHLVLARWQDQDICLDCLEHRPGKEEAEAEARGEIRPPVLSTVMSPKDLAELGERVRETKVRLIAELLSEWVKSNADISAETAPPPASLLRFVQCQNCQELYPAPGDHVCPFCDDPDPDWQPWDPRDEDLDDHRLLYTTIEGLLMLLHDRHELQDDDGRVYEAVRDAMAVLSQDRETAQTFRGFWMQE